MSFYHGAFGAKIVDGKIWIPSYLRKIAAERGDVRFNLFGAKECQYLSLEPDSSGKQTLERIVVPTLLRESAGIKRDVTVCGIKDHIEIWNPELLEKHIDKIHEDPMFKLACDVIFDDAPVYILIGPIYVPRKIADPSLN